VKHDVVQGKAKKKKKNPRKEGGGGGSTQLLPRTNVRKKQTRRDLQNLSFITVGLSKKWLKI